MLIATIINLLSSLLIALAPGGPPTPPCAAFRDAADFGERWTHPSAWLQCAPPAPTKK